MKSNQLADISKDIGGIDNIKQWKKCIKQD